MVSMKMLIKLLVLFFVTGITETTTQAIEVSLDGSSAALNQNNGSRGDFSLTVGVLNDTQEVWYLHNESFSLVLNDVFVPGSSFVSSTISVVTTATPTLDSHNTPVFILPVGMNQTFQFNLLGAGTNPPQTGNYAWEIDWMDFEPSSGGAGLGIIFDSVSINDGTVYDQFRTPSLYIAAPEPSTSILILFGLGGLVLSFRRKFRCAG